MADPKLKLGNDIWATKQKSLLAYNDEGGNFKSLPFQVDRISGGTYVGRNGLIQSAASNEPRIDFLNNTKGHLLLEPSRTNKMPSSEDFNGADWNRASLTINSDDAISPYGTSTADKITFTGNGSLRTWNTFTFTDAYTYSIFVKKGNSRYVTLRSFAFTTSAAIGFDLDTVTSETGGVIEQYPNDWFRLSISKDISSDADKNGYFYFYLPNNLGSTTSVSGNYAYIFGNQIEEGSYATSYIPTSGSAVTRVVDGIEQSGFQGKVMNATQGTIFIHFNNPIEDGDNNDFHMFRSEGASGIENGFLFRLNTGTGVDILERVLNATGAQFSNIVVKGQENKIAISFTSSTLLGSGNGVTKSYAGTYLGTKINIDEFQNSGATLQGFDIIDMKFYDTALTQEEINALTS